jgi:EpsD family peptidyl-prolyl cis-trans isomerase
MLLTTKISGPRRRGAVVLLGVALALSACGNKEKAASQSLASVDGTEITTMQLNEEIGLARVQPGQPEANKRVLEGLVDRQVLVAAAENDKLDRDPKVLQQIARARALILAQAYMQKRVGALAPPTRAEVSDYFTKHPELFTQRKQYDMRQLVLATKDMTDELKKEIDGAKSLEEVATWLDAHKVQFGRSQLARSSADLPPELVTRLNGMTKGQLFIVREGERSMLMSLNDIKEAPVTLEQAAPQIEQYLVNTRNKEAAGGEIARLRKLAKIEYLNKEYAAAPAAPAPATAKPDDGAKANERGVAGLK